MHDYSEFILDILVPLLSHILNSVSQYREGWFKDFFYTSKIGLGFQLMFKADRPASYGRRRHESHLLVSSWKILWSGLQDPAFGKGGDNVQHNREPVL